MTKKKVATDYYRVLGVDPEAELHTIRSAYRRLARRYHPDVAGKKNAGKRFLIIQEAYEVLSDPERRREYDRLISKSSVATERTLSRRTVPPTESSVLRRGFRIVVDALGIRVDACVRFGGHSGHSSPRHRPSGRQAKKRK